MKAAASTVLFLYRATYYHPETPTENPESAEIIVAKNIAGTTGTAYVSFDCERLSFK